MPREVIGLHHPGQLGDHIAPAGHCLGADPSSQHGDLAGDQEAARLSLSFSDGRYRSDPRNPAAIGVRGGRLRGVSECSLSPKGIANQPGARVRAASQVRISCADNDRIKPPLFSTSTAYSIRTAVGPILCDRVAREEPILGGESPRHRFSQSATLGSRLARVTRCRRASLGPDQMETI